MKIYHFGEILRQIHKGTQVDFKANQQCLSSKARLKDLKKILIKIDSVSSLLVSLTNINIKKFSLAFFLMVFQLGLVISSPFLANYLIDNYLDVQDSSLLLLLVIFAGYKCIKVGVGIICDFCYQSLGYQYFARLYWHILTNYRVITGKMLNLIEYDCNMISNFPYASLTAFFNCIQILVVIGLFSYYLYSISTFSVFLVIISLYLISQALASYLTFCFTKKYLIQKDKRLNFNIDHNLSQQMLLQRQQQLKQNSKFLYSKIFSKFISTVFPILINIYIFIIADRNQIKDIQYILLILISLIRSPISELLFTLNLIVQISYSVKRIVFFGTEETDKDRFLDKTHNHQSNALLLNHSTQEQISSERQRIFRETQLNTQKGYINISKIAKYCLDSQNTNRLYWIFLVLSILLLLVVRCYNYFVTKHIISNSYSAMDLFGLGLQVASPLAFYYILIKISQQIAKSLFKSLKESSFDCQYLNRISGDISSIDRSISINLNQTISSFAFIISSYLYSILSLKNIPIQIGLTLFLIICLVVAIKANRFIMLSRRQVSRQQCILKSKIIKQVLKNKQIQSSREMKKPWRQIFECKIMGLFIQNYFMIILNAILLIFTLVLLSICKQIDMNYVSKSIILIACFNIDYDLINTFLSAVRLQICLVSFQRVINILNTK